MNLTKIKNVATGIVASGITLASNCVYTFASSVGDSSISSNTDTTTVTGASEYMASHLFAVVCNTIHPWTAAGFVIGLIMFIFGTQAMKQWGRGIFIGAIVAFFLTTNTGVTAMTSLINTITGISVG